MSQLLLLAGKWGYQTRSFAEAAKALGVDVVFASDRCHQLEDPWADGAIAVRFDDPEDAARRIVKESLVRPVDGLIALGDRSTATAAYTARALGFAYNSPQSVENCRSKLRQREVLRDAGEFAGRISGRRCANQRIARIPGSKSHARTRTRPPACGTLHSRRGSG